jgi:hypothetical protein
VDKVTGVLKGMKKYGGEKEALRDRVSGVVGSGLHLPNAVQESKEEGGGREGDRKDNKINLMVYIVLGCERYVK